MLHGLRAVVANMFAQMQSMLWIDVKKGFTVRQSLLLTKSLSQAGTFGSHDVFCCWCLSFKSQVSTADREERKVLPVQNACAPSACTMA